MQRFHKKNKRLCQKSQTENRSRSLKDNAHHHKRPNLRPSRGPSPASRLGALPGTASSYIIAALYEATNKLRNKTVKEVAKDARSVKIEKNKQNTYED